MFGLPRDDERCCPTDGTVCDLFQPDDQQPLRLLLVCPECGRWIIMVGFSHAQDPGITWREEAHYFSPAAVAVAG